MRWQSGKPKKRGKLLSLGSHNIDIDVSIRCRRFSVKAAWVKEIVSAVFCKEKVYGQGEVSVILVNDKTITGLNTRYLNHPYPTDVIAFPSDNIFDLYKNNKTTKWILGDVVVSLETAERQALFYRHSFHKELALLIVHGVLHLLGYSDKTPNDCKIIRQKEREILKYCEVT